MTFKQGDSIKGITNGMDAHLVRGFHNSVVWFDDGTWEGDHVDAQDAELVAAAPDPEPVATGDLDDARQALAESPTLSRHFVDAEAVVDGIIRTWDRGGAIQLSSSQVEILRSHIEECSDIFHGPLTRPIEVGDTVTWLRDPMRREVFVTHGGQ